MGEVQIVMRTAELCKVEVKVTSLYMSCVTIHMVR